MGGVCGLGNLIRILEGVCRDGFTCVVAGGVDYEEIFVFLLVQRRPKIYLVLMVD